jgi:hypothetical protein
LEETPDLDDLILAQVTRATRSKGDNLAVHGDGPVAIVCFMHLTKTFKQHTDVVPLDVVIQRVSVDFLDSDSVVVIQLD